MAVSAHVIPPAISAMVRSARWTMATSSGGASRCHTDEDGRRSSWRLAPRFCVLECGVGGGIDVLPAGPAGCSYRRTSLRLSSTITATRRSRRVAAAGRADLLPAAALLRTPDIGGDPWRRVRDHPIEWRRWVQHAPGQYHIEWDPPPPPRSTARLTTAAGDGGTTYSPPYHHHSPLRGGALPHTMS